MDWLGVGFVRTRPRGVVLLLLRALVPLQAVASTGPFGSFTGTVFDDLDGSGGQDASEDGLADVTVTVTGANLDGTFDTGDDTLSTAATGADGRCSAGDLPAGEGWVEVDESTVRQSGALTTAGHTRQVGVGGGG